MSQQTRSGAGGMPAKPTPDARTVGHPPGLSTALSVPTTRSSRHFPTRNISRCPYCGAAGRSVDPFGGRFGDSLRRCGSCCQRSERRDWRVAA